MQSKQIGIKSISAYLEQIGVALREDMIPFWTDYGFDLIGFFITSIDIDDKTPDGQEILRAMAQQSAQSIAGYTWQQGESFRVAEKALSSQGDIGVWGAAMMAGGNLFGGNSGAGGIFQPVPTSVGSQVTASGQVTEPSVRQIFCSKCAKKYPSTSKFCPHCGNEAHLCLKCGSDNDAHAANCVACGASLQSAAETITCPKCSTAAPKDSTFCPQCGTTLAKMCPRCKSKMPDNAPFCPTCGLKTE
jgi:membrane protease subunit (stomatin/prohibitin family)